MAAAADSRNGSGNAFQHHLESLSWEFEQLRQENRILLEENAALKNCQKETGGPCDVEVGKQSDELRWQSSFAFSDLWTRNCTATLEDGKKGRGVAAVAQVGQSTASTMLPASEAETGAPAAATHAGNASQSNQHPLEMKSRRSALWLPTVSDMKSIIREELENREAVEEANQDRYKDTGVFQCIARSNVFEHLTTSMIVIYSVWLAVDIDYNPRVVNTDTSSVFFWVEQFFCCFFVLEVSIRFLAFSSTWRWSRDFWFLFDLFLVMSMAIQVWLLPLLDSMLQSNHVGTIFADTGIIRVARLLRLSRLLRMSQLLHLFPEVLILVKAIAAALRSVVFTLALLLMILYVFAIAFTQLTRGTGCARQYFSSVPASMQTLFISGALLDEVGTLMNDLLAENLYFSLTLMYTFVIMSAITVMNMLIGVMCEVISAVASAEKEAIQVQWLRKVLERVAGGPDKRINQQKFFEILRDEGAANAMKGIGIDLISLVDFAELIFEESGDATDIDAEANEAEISFDDFLKHVLQLRGSNTATVKDMVDLRWWLSQSLHLKLQATVEKTLEKGQLSQLQVQKAPLAG
mmetsp:Transcript_33833/g.78639  ORF Transcript_33833/g.78639 Transcript_33833/m.78639 type:complete len:578 (+) Transcript_33833:53-1786(+)